MTVLITRPLDYIPRRDDPAKMLYVGGSSTGEVIVGPLILEWIVVTGYLSAGGGDKVTSISDKTDVAGSKKIWEVGDDPPVFKPYYFNSTYMEYGLFWERHVLDAIYISVGYR